MHQTIDEDKVTVPQSTRQLGYEKAVEVFEYHMKKPRLNSQMVQIAKDSLEKIKKSAETPGKTDGKQWADVMNDFIMATLLLVSTADALKEIGERLALVMGPSAVLIEPFLFVLKGIERNMNPIPVDMAFRDAKTYALEVDKALEEMMNLPQESTIVTGDFSKKRLH